MRHILFSGLILMLCLAQGCTTKAWYEGLQESQRQECYKEKSQTAIQKCLDRQMTYEQHQAEREKTGTKP